ncbi:hypothetical protein ARMGADRAFT_1035563 [Armillaria gallica]|uniref:Helicase C-terminal domain-containing protein n=1 Tax=Armillaria gallica TaxID=47427 RepID=A0A2H3DBC8_ARMGA|nr:hypothetical protein ARMGADRAFT_1035563 [Armillaria gallica]
MSLEYLAHAHKQFTSETGKCWILCATSAESTGIDFPDINIIVKAALPESMAYSLQCRGHVLRWGQRTGIYVIFYEPWVEDIDLDEYEGTFPDHPDHPCTTLMVKSLKHNCAPLSAVTLIKGRMCKCQFHAHYLSDTNPRCLDYSGKYCCDSHDNGFKLEDFLPSPLHTAPASDNSASGKEKKQNASPEIPNQSSAMQKSLVAELLQWHQQQHRRDPLRAVRPEHDIITTKNITQLSCVGLLSLNSVDLVVEILAETKDWAEEW